MKNTPLIHILPQESWHSHAAIVGNKEGLTLLRELIDAVVNGADVVSSGKMSGGVQVFCNDGEGYNITVLVRPDMSDVPLGYTSYHAKDNRDYPEWLKQAISSSEASYEKTIIHG